MIYTHFLHCTDSYTHSSLNWEGTSYSYSRGKKKQHLQCMYYKTIMTAAHNVERNLYFFTLKATAANDCKPFTAHEPNTWKVKTCLLPFVLMLWPNKEICCADCYALLFWHTVPPDQFLCRLLSESDLSYEHGDVGSSKADTRSRRDILLTSMGLWKSKECLTKMTAITNLCMYPLA